MAIETIEAVRQAELKAVQLEKEAAANKDELLSQAKKKAAELIQSKSEEALAKADVKVREAEKKGLEQLEATKVNAEKSILFMKDLVKVKEKEVIDLIISNVI